MNSDAKNESLNLSRLRRMDPICERFEQAWKRAANASAGPNLETPVAEVPPEDREYLLKELLAIEIFHRRRLNEPISAEVLRQRFTTLDDAWLDTAIESQSRPNSDATRHTLQATTLSADFGDYVLEKELARGGMGAVYRAVDRKLHRVVALKVVLAGALASEEQRRRFQLEAEAVAQLDHPHIIPIYEVGVHEQQPYFTMKLMEGGSLAQACRENRWPAKPGLRHSAIATLVTEIARAVHFAHQRGVLHRDLKPGNILLDAQGMACVTDFGLAKWADRDHSMTQTGQIVGTPEYMSPEQASGQHRQVSTASDIYSLGAVLYFLLTGSPPFRSEQLTDLLRQVENDDPIPPRQIRSDVPADLETICLKCLEKEPTKRYGSAADLADDIERYRRDEPIQARRTSAAERAWRTMRRNPQVTALCSIIAIAIPGLLIWLTATAWQLDGANTLLTDTNSKLDDANKDLAGSNLQLAKSVDSEKRERKLAVDTLYVQSILLAKQAINDGQRRNAREILAKCPPDLRRWDWEYLNRLADDRKVVRTLPNRVNAWKLMPRKNQLVIATPKTLETWDVESWTCLTRVDLPEAKTPVDGLVCFPDEQNVAILRGVGKNTPVQVVEIATGKLKHSTVAEGYGSRFVDVTVDSKQLLIGVFRGCQMVEVGGDNVVTLAKLTQPVRGVAASPDNVHVAIVSSSVGRGSAEWLVVDRRNQREVRAVRGESQVVTGLCFSPDGGWLALGNNKGDLHLFELVSQKFHSLAAHPTKIGALTFSPRGNQLATYSDNVVKVWNVHTKELINSFRDDVRSLREMAITDDGRKLISQHYESTFVIRELASAESLVVLPDDVVNDARRHEKPSPTSGLVVAKRQLPTKALEKGDLPRAGLSQSQFSDLLQGDAKNPSDQDDVLPRFAVPVFSTDANGLRRMFSGRSVRWTDLQVSKSNVTDPRSTPARVLHPSGKWAYVLDPSLVTGIFTGVMPRTTNETEGDDETSLTKTRHPDWWRHDLMFPGRINLWEANSEKPSFDKKERLVGTAPVALSTDGKLLAVANVVDRDYVDPRPVRVIRARAPKGLALEILDTKTGDLLASTLLPDLGAMALAFHPDRNEVHCGCISGELLAFNCETRQSRVYCNVESPITALAFDSQNKHLALGTMDRSIHVFDARTMEKRRTLLNHLDAIISLDFDSTGKLLASAGSDDRVKVWDVASGTEVLDFPASFGGDRVRVVAFLPKNAGLVASSVRGTIALIDHAQRTQLGLDLLPWHRVTAEEAFREQHWFTAWWHASKFPERHYKDTSLAIIRDFSLAQLGRWHETRLEQVRMHPDNLKSLSADERLMLGWLYVHQGQLDSYRQLCDAGLSVKHPIPLAAGLAMQQLRLATLGPVHPKDRDRLLGIATELEKNRGTPGQTAQVLGLLHYRLASLEEAEKYANTAVKAYKKSPSNVNFYLLALIARAKNDPKQMQRWQQEADAHADQLVITLPDTRSNMGTLVQQLLAKALKRELETM